MAVYEVTDNRTGKVYEVSGERPPTESELENLIVSQLPKPSIMERISASALAPNDSDKRAYFLNRGKNPNEPGMFTSPREAMADILESATPWVKGAAQIGGEVAGSAVGAASTIPSAGVINPVTGFIVGGAVGRGAAQAGYEALANATDTGLPNDVSRIGKEALVGGATSALGKGLSKVGQTIYKNPLIKKGEEYLLTNVTQMSKGMQNWIKERGWDTVYNKAKEPVRMLAKNVQTNFIEPLKRLEDNLGQKVTALKYMIHSDVVKPDYTGLSKEVGAIFPRYGNNITSDERAILSSIANRLEKSGGSAIQTASASGDAKLASKLSNMYISAIDDLTTLGRQVVSAYSKNPKDALGGVSAVNAAASEVQGLITKRAAALNKELGPAIDQFVKFSKVYKTIQDNIGKSPRQILRFFSKHLFADDDPTNILGRDAVSDIFTPEWLGESSLERMKDLAAAAFMRYGNVLTAGVKTFLPGAITTGLGATTGLATGGFPGLKRGARIGAQIGGALTLPYMVPALQSSIYRGLEKFSPGVGAAINYSTKLLAAPLSSVINRLGDQFGIQATDEDIKKLKNSRLKNIK